MNQKTEAAKEAYQNERVQFEVNHKPLCVVEYETEVFRPICIDSYNKAVRVISKEVVIPGYRKGKAPPEVVAKRYPHDLDKKWQEILANTTYKECSQLANVPLVRQDATITFNMHSHSKEGAKLTLAFETVPSIPTIDPAQCVLKPVKRPEVSPEKVKETIRQTQLFFAQWKPVHKRKIEENDYVILDIDVIEKEPHEKLFANTRFEVSDKSMAKWMKPLVLGKHAGDVVEGLSVPDPELTEEEKSEYAPKKVRITIRSIEEATLPELDDAFAKQLGVDSVEELNQRIEELLNKKADEHVHEKQREQVTEFLLSHPFEIPNSVIEKEIRFRLEQMAQDKDFKSQWDQSSDKERRELIDSIKVQAEKAVRLFYICRKIASVNSITLAQKDIVQTAQTPVEALLYPSAQPHDTHQPDVKQAEAYSRVLLEKAEDWVIAHARTS